MSAIVITTFSGIAPKLSPRLLADAKAQKAENVKLWSGELRPMSGPLQIGSNLLSKAGTKKAIYRFGQDSSDEANFWFHWTTDVDVVRGSIAGDTTERTYYTGDSEPRFTFSPVATTGAPYPSAYYRLGLPSPAAGASGTTSSPTISTLTHTGTTAHATTPVDHGLSTGGTAVVSGATPAGYNGTFTNITVTGARTFDYTLAADPGADATGTITYTQGGLLESRVYAFAYVSSLGEEGPLSVPTALINVYPGQTVNLINLPNAPAGAYSVDRLRIYRTQSGNTDSTYRLVNTVAIGTSTYADAKAGTNLGGSVPFPLRYAPPPDLFALKEGPNGMVAGLSYTDGLCFCYPYEPHGWPTAYRYALKKKPMGLGQFAQTWVVLTEGCPVLFSGVGHPMSSEDVKVGQPCLSKRSVVSMNGSVYYACPEGLAVISASGFGLVTNDVFTKDEWKAFAPASISGYEWNGRYVGFYDTGTVQAGFVFEPLTGDFYTLNFYATAGYYDPKNHALYLAVGNNVVKFDEGTALTYDWRSKIFAIPSPSRYAFAKVVATAYPVTFKLYVDGALAATKSVANAKPFRLPDWKKGTEFEIELSGTAPVRGVAISETIKDFRTTVE